MKTFNGSLRPLAAGQILWREIQEEAMTELPSKERVVKIRTELNTLAPPLMPIQYHEMSNMCQDLLTLLDACRAYIKITLSLNDEALLMSMKTGRDLIERIGDGQQD
jgi:hypothetical protein